METNGWPVHVTHFNKNNKNHRNKTKELPPFILSIHCMEIVPWLSNVKIISKKTGFENCLQTIKKKKIVITFPWVLMKAIQNARYLSRRSRKVQTYYFIIVDFPGKPCTVKRHIFIVSQKMEPFSHLLVRFSPLVWVSPSLFSWRINKKTHS